MERNCGKISGEKLRSRRRLPIPETLCRQSESNGSHRKPPYIRVTDSRDELITFCPVSGGNPGGVSSQRRDIKPLIAAATASCSTDRAAVELQRLV